MSSKRKMYVEVLAPISQNRTAFGINLGIIINENMGFIGVGCVLILLNWCPHKRKQRHIAGKRKIEV